MRYVQLRAFHNVALCGGFSRAAEQLGLTQPAISDQVRRLEADYDMLLFNRIRRRVTLTNQGRRLFEFTTRMFEAETDAREFLSETQAMRSGQLRIVADSAYHVTGLIIRFQDRYPKVRISLRSGNTNKVIDSLLAYEAEIGVVGNLAEHGELETVPLGTSSIVAFAAKGHPLENRGPVSLKLLAEYPLILRERVSKTRQRIERAAANEGLSLVPLIEAEGREAVRETVAGGTGIGFVSEAEFGKDERLVKIPISGPDITMEEKLVCVKQRSEVRMIRAFMGLARNSSG